MDQTCFFNFKVTLGCRLASLYQIYLGEQMYGLSCSKTTKLKLEYSTAILDLLCPVTWMADSTGTYHVEGCVGNCYIPPQNWSWQTNPIPPAIIPTILPTAGDILVCNLLNLVNQILP